MATTNTTSALISSTKREDIANKYREMVFARRHFDLLNRIDQSPLPKWIYGKRKNGLKKRMKPAKNVAGESKHQTFQQATFRGYLELQRAEREFGEVIKDLTPAQQATLPNVIKV